VAQEVHQFSCTIDPGTTPDSPAVFPLEIAYYDLESLDLEVPPGPNGLVGFYIALSGQEWFPWEQGEWIIWNDRTENWPTNDQSINGTWQLIGYNLGQYEHTVTVRFHVNPIDTQATPTPPTLTFITNIEPQPALVL
jgi:hypothetical protein